MRSGLMWCDEDEPSHDASVPDGLEGIEDPGETWVAHDDPARRLTSGAWLCDCRVCRHALEGVAARNPGLPIVITTSVDRIVVTAARAVEAWHAYGALEGLLLLPYDYICGVFVGAGLPASMDGEFWSLKGSWPSTGRPARDGAARA
jgi:hypothetical protein